MTKLRERKQFCKHGHDTFICGRYSDGSCKECKQEKFSTKYVPHPRKPIQICPKGHDKDIVGRTKDNICKECLRIWSKEWRQEHKKEIKEKKGLEYIKNKDEHSRKHHEYYEAHKDEIKKSVKEYIENNQEQINERLVIRRKIDLNFKLKEILRNRITKSNKKKSKGRISR